MKIKTSKQIRKMNMGQIDKYETQLLKSGEYVPAVVFSQKEALWIKKYGKMKKYTSIPSHYILLTAIVWLYGLMLLLTKN